MLKFVCFVPRSVVVFAIAFALSPHAASGQTQVSDAAPDLIDVAQLLEEPPAIPAHLQEMFDRMEASNRRSQDVFRTLNYFWFDPESLEFKGLHVYT